MGERLKEVSQAKLLIVEDERIMAEDLKSRLEGMGFRVVGIAVSAEQAFALAERERPDLAIMDIQIKGPLNGIETAQRLRERFDCAFIYLTAYADRNTLDQIRPTAPHGFILKPFDSHELMGVLETTLYKIQIEKELKERAAWISSVLRSMGDGLIAVNPDQRIMVMNAEAEALTGWTQEQSRDRELGEVLRLADEATGEPRPLAEIVGGEGDVQTLRLSPRRGHDIPVELSQTPMKDEAGEEAGMVWVIRDISARREAEWAVKTSEERYRRLYESITDAVVTVDVDEQIISCNDAFCAMLGYSREEVLGRSTFDLTPREWHERMRVEVETHVLERGYSDVYEKEYVRRDGQRIAVEMRAFLLRDASGEPQAIWALIRDISARKREEKTIFDRLRRLERQEAALIRLANDDVLRGGSLDEALALIVEQAAVALDLDRTSIWFVSAGRRLTCRALNDRSGRGTPKPLDLEAVPHYWKSVIALRTLDVADVTQDNRTPELVAAYCAPQGITAMLESSIRLSGEVVGVFCAEHRGGSRFWHEDERVFCAEIADQVAQILLHQERRKAEADLRESERNYREIFNATGEIVLIHDAQSGQILDANQSALELLDCRYEEILNLFPGMGSADPEHFSSDKARTYIAQAVARGSVEFEWKARKRDGSTVWLEMTLRSAVIGSQPRVLAVGRDITERKESEVRLARAATFRKRVTELATQFINLSLSAVPQRLGATLQRIGQTLECRRCGLFRLDVERSAMGLYRLWQAEGQIDIEAVLAQSSEIIFSAFHERLASGESFVLRLPGDLPSKAKALRETLKLDSDRSWLFSPLIHENLLVGCLVLEIEYVAARWSEEERDLLIVATEMITNVLVRSESESRLQASERRYRHLFDSAGDGIAILDSSVFVDCNPKTLELFDCAREAFIGHEVLAFSAETQISGRAAEVEIQEHVGAALAGQAQHFEWIHRRKTGALFHAEISLSAIELEDGRYVQAMIRDISERKRAEQELKASEERFRNLADMLPQPIYESDLVGRILYANQSAFRVFGYKKDDLKSGLVSFNLLSEEDREEAWKNAKRLLQGEELMAREYTALRRDGHRFPVITYSNLIYNDGQAVGFRGIVMDITELRRAEAALKESEEKYRHLVERANDGVAIVTQGRIRFVNNPLCQMLGIKRESLIGQTYGRYVGEEDKAFIEANAKKHLLGEETPSIFEVTLRNGQGLELPVEVNAGMIPYQGQPSAFVFIRDIAERRKAQEALRTAQQTHHLASLGTLAAGISHEINQPLMALKVKVDSMLYWGESDEALLQKNLSQNLHFISTEADKIDAIIRHMRSLIRMEKVSSQPLDINATITYATQLIGQRLASHGIRFELALSHRMPLVMSHATSIEQVLINLLVNAMYALDEMDKEDKWIMVRTRKQGKRCRIEVMDNGPGIPEAHINRIFDSLFTTRENGESMGLGLPIVQYLLSQVEGSVQVSNRQEGGACFSVDLPLAVK